MRSALSLLFLLAPAVASAQQQDIRRALIQRDQQSAEFAAQLRGGIEARRQLELVHERQLLDATLPLSPNADVADALRPFERRNAAAESDGAVLRFSPPVRRPGSYPELRPLALPGGLRPGVEPVAAPGIGG